MGHHGSQQNVSLLSIVIIVTVTLFQVSEHWFTPAWKKLTPWSGPIKGFNLALALHLKQAFAGTGSVCGTFWTSSGDWAIQVKRWTISDHLTQMCFFAWSQNVSEYPGSNCKLIVHPCKQKSQNFVQYMLLLLIYYKSELSYPTFIMQRRP